MTVQMNREENVVIMPEHYRQEPRLALWYKCGFNQAQRGVVPSDNWLQLISHDESGWDAYQDGYGAGESHRGYTLVADTRWSR